MENKLLKEINDKLNIILSLFNVKEDGKEKTLLEKYNETKKEKVMSVDKDMLENYRRNVARGAGYLKDLREILSDSFNNTGSPPSTDENGYFEVDGFVYNIKDN